MKIACSVSSNTGSDCPYCDNFLRPDPASGSLDEIAHHLQTIHALECLHVGTETALDADVLWHCTIMVFGSENPPARKGTIFQVFRNI